MRRCRRRSSQRTALKRAGSAQDVGARLPVLRHRCTLCHRSGAGGRRRPQHRLVTRRSSPSGAAARSSGCAARSKRRHSSPMVRLRGRMHAPPGRARRAVRACRRASAGRAAAGATPAHRTPGPRRAARPGPSSAAPSAAHCARRPQRALDGVQLREHRIARGSSVSKPATRLMKSSPVEAHGAVAVPGRKAHAGKLAPRARRPRAPRFARARRCCRRRRRPRHGR